jgi:hypothetical protein
MWTIGSLTAINLIAAMTNAFSGALLARRKDHFRYWTVVGIILMRPSCSRPRYRCWRPRMWRGPRRSNG